MIYVIGVFMYPFSGGNEKIKTVHDMLHKLAKGEMTAQRNNYGGRERITKENID